MNRQNRTCIFDSITKQLDAYSEESIENSLIAYLLNDVNLIDNSSIFSDLQTSLKFADSNIVNIFAMNAFPTDIESIVEYFEYLIESENRNENGIVFTPKYIADFIATSLLSDTKEWKPSIKIIDPGCGCGIFLIAAIETIHAKYGTSIIEILRNNIYGIDILKRNARRCKTVLQIYCVKHGIYNLDFDLNIIANNSLDCNWNDIWDVEGFDFVIGNPPYVNTHDMTKETAQFLKKNFNTTKTGVYNIFYAFVEQGYNYLKDTGFLSYIVPNNFMTIKSAILLREMIRNNKSLYSILDFADNMVFRPVRTYNCIITLSKAPRNEFKYYVAEKTDEIENLLNSIVYGYQGTDMLDDNGWKLVDGTTLKNIEKIEGQGVPLKEFVRTGIATLRDEVYFVNEDKEGFYKEIDGEQYRVDSEIVKPIYKIPELKNCSNHLDVVRHIIFPYSKGEKGFELISESVLADRYSATYSYLLAMKHILDERDKGKGNPYAWYAYGRSQGLNKYGRKLLFPTFASKPNFIYVDDELSLFCNGYAVFENEQVSLNLLLKVLNSKVMEYYVKNTSYPIKGGYYCYQKKYIERFSLPKLSKDEEQQIITGDQDFVDSFLLEKYALAI
jgi:type I restriction-modification system DNA methylase subunit